MQCLVALLIPLFAHADVHSVSDDKIRKVLTQKSIQLLLANPAAAKFADETLECKEALPACLEKNVDVYTSSENLGGAYYTQFADFDVTCTLVYFFDKNLNLLAPSQAANQWRCHSESSTDD